jgi:hypothetical protein
MGVSSSRREREHAFGILYIRYLVYRFKLRQRVWYATSCWCFVAPESNSSAVVMYFKGFGPSSLEKAPPVTKAPTLSHVLSL